MGRLSLQSLRETCSRTVIPIQLPIGEEKSFKGVVDLVTKRAYLFEEGESGKCREAAVPAAMTGAVDTAREQLIEMIAEADEALMERFFEAGTLTDEELVGGLRAATAAGKVFPLVCTSGLANVGVQPLLDTILAYLPSPADRPFPALGKGGQATTVKADEKAGAAAFVWKTIADPFAGRITMFRVVSGTLNSDSTVHNRTRDLAERIGSLQLLQGKTPSPVPEVKAGDLATVAKLKDTLTNDTLGDKAALVLMRGHGNAVVAPRLRVLVGRAIYTEENARLQLQAMSLGKVNYLAPGEVEKMESLVGNSGQDRIWDMWKAKAEQNPTIRKP